MDTTISDRTGLTLGEAVAECKKMSQLLNCKVFPARGTGWSSAFLSRIHSRMDYLRGVIVDEVVKNSEVQNDAGN